MLPPARLRAAEHVIRKHVPDEISEGLEGKRGGSRRRLERGRRSARHRPRGPRGAVVCVHPQLVLRSSLTRASGPALHRRPRQSLRWSPLVLPSSPTPAPSPCQHKKERAYSEEDRRVFSSRSWRPSRSISEHLPHTSGVRGCGPGLLGAYFRVLEGRSGHLAPCFGLLALCQQHLALCFWLLALCQQQLAPCFWLLALCQQQLALCFWLLALCQQQLAPCFWLLALCQQHLPHSFWVPALCLQRLAPCFFVPRCISRQNRPKEEEKRASPPLGRNSPKASPLSPLSRRLGSFFLSPPAFPLCHSVSSVVQTPSCLFQTPSGRANSPSVNVACVLSRPPPSLDPAQESGGPGRAHPAILVPKDRSVPVLSPLCRQQMLL